MPTSMFWATGHLPGGASESWVRERAHPHVFTKHFCITNFTHLFTKVTSLNPYEVGKLKHGANLCSAGRWPLRPLVSSLRWTGQGRPARLSHLCCSDPVALSTLPCTLRFTIQESVPGAESSVSKLVLVT